MRTAQFLAGFAVLSLALAATAGCGNSSGAVPVTGTVTWADGSPVTEGMVYFQGDGVTATGPIQPDGKYALGSMDLGDGAPPGTYQVTLGGVGGGYDNPKGPVLDPKYESPTTSGLSYEVKAGETNVYDIKVEKQK